MTSTMYVTECVRRKVLRVAESQGIELVTRPGCWTQADVQSYARALGVPVRQVATAWQLASLGKG